ncbi:MAG: alpha/beta hydrolase [Deltaproteobacteria bacterium]|nr:alpha/beta hydrolase [Deltaproteobacteria bacterium]MBW2304908.1 alpha/beta hydrolase [Deltaproteobacteria bacterium]
MIIEIDGIPIHLQEEKTAEEVKPPALFFIHGAGGDCSQWNRQAAYFRQTHPVYLLDLPGHGKSGGGGEKEIGAYAEWVRKVIQRISPDSPILLVGHSMGGAVVQTLALDPWQGLAGIVLVGTGAKLGVLPEIFRMLEKDPESFFCSIDVAAFHPKTPREIRDSVIQGIRRCPPPVIHGDFTACDRFDIRTLMDKISSPALIICGDRDKLTPVKYSMYLKDSIPSSRLEIIPEAGHQVMMEQADAFNSAMAGFIDGLGLPA